MKRPLWLGNAALALVLGAVASGCTVRTVGPPGSRQWWRLCRPAATTPQCIQPARRPSRSRSTGRLPLAGATCGWTATGTGRGTTGPGTAATGSRSGPATPTSGLATSTSKAGRSTTAATGRARAATASTATAAGAARRRRPHGAARPRRRRRPGARSRLTTTGAATRRRPPLRVVGLARHGSGPGAGAGRRLARRDPRPGAHDRSSCGGRWLARRNAGPTPTTAPPPLAAAGAAQPRRRPPRRRLRPAGGGWHGGAARRPAPAPGAAAPAPRRRLAGRDPARPAVRPTPPPAGPAAGSPWRGNTHAYARRRPRHRRAPTPAPSRSRPARLAAPSATPGVDLRPRRRRLARRSTYQRRPDPQPGTPAGRRQLFGGGRSAPRRMGASPHRGPQHRGTGRRPPRACPRPLRAGPGAPQRVAARSHRTGRLPHRMYCDRSSSLRIPSRRSRT